MLVRRMLFFGCFDFVPGVMTMVSIKELTKKLRDRRATVRFEAALSITTMDKPPRVVTALVPLLKDVRRVRRMAVSALGEIAGSGVASAEAALAKLLIEADDAEDRLHVAFTLSHMKRPPVRSVGALVRALKDRSERVRRVVIYTLGHCTESVASSASALVKFLNEARSAEDRRCVARAFATMKRPPVRAVGALVQALKDVDVRGWAILALEKIGPAAAPAAVAPLTALLNDPDEGLFAKLALAEIQGR